MRGAPPQFAAGSVAAVVALALIALPITGIEPWLQYPRALGNLAAVYDMTADEERNRAANVDGTRHAVELADALAAGCLHHTSSIAVAGATI